jgi:hypothetical protein
MKSEFLLGHGFSKVHLRTASGNSSSQWLTPQRSGPRQLRKFLQLGRVSLPTNEIEADTGSKISEIAQWDGLPTSAEITLPANSILVFTRVRIEPLVIHVAVETRTTTCWTSTTAAVTVNRAQARA